MNVSFSPLQSANAIRNRVQSVQNRVMTETPKIADSHRYDQGGSFDYADFQLSSDDRISNVSTYKSASGRLAHTSFDTAEGQYTAHTERAAATGFKHGLAVAGSMLGMGGMLAMSVIGCDKLAAPFAKLYSKSQIMDEGAVGNTTYTFRPKNGQPTEQYIFNASGTLTSF